MGDEAKTETEVMEANAAAEESVAEEGAVGTPPAESATETTETTETVETTEAPETPPVADSLSGDESVEDVEKFLREKIARKETLSENDVDQMLRWRRTGHEGKTAIAELEGAKASTAALERLAAEWGMSDKLREMGPEKFTEWGLTAPETKAATEENFGLDPSDPVQKALIDTKREVLTLRSEKAQAEGVRKTQEADQTRGDAFVAQIDVGFKDQPDEVKRAAWDIMDSAYRRLGGSYESLDKEAVEKAFAHAKEALKALTTTVSTKTKAEIDESKPETPNVVEVKELPGERREDDEEMDVFEREQKQMEANATREGA